MLPEGQQYEKLKVMIVTLIDHKMLQLKVIKSIFNLSTNLYHKDEQIYEQVRTCLLIMGSQISNTLHDHFKLVKRAFIKGSKIEHLNCVFKSGNLNRVENINKYICLR